MPTVKPTSPVLDTGNSLATNIYLAWLFVEGSGTTITDYSGNGYHGTVENAVPTWETGDYGAELALDGTNDAVRRYAADMAAYGTGAYTVMMVFNNRTTTGINVFGALGNDINYGGGERSAGFYSNGTQLNFHTRDGTGDTTISASGWTTGYHILIARKPTDNTGTGKTAYIDNDTPITLNTFNENIGGGVTFGVNSQDVAQDWHPEIDLVTMQIWSRGITDTEIDSLLADPFVHFRGSGETATGIFLGTDF